MKYAGSWPYSQTLKPITGNKLEFLFFVTDFFSSSFFFLNLYTFTVSPDVTILPDPRINSLQQLI